MRISLLLSALLTAAPSALPHPALATEPEIEQIGCERADERITLTESARLDPSCTWTKGVRITASDVTLDCQGATIASPGGGLGVHIVAPTDVPLSGVRVRNCHIEGFLNCLHVERDGFRTLPEGEEYEAAFSDIVVEDSSMRNSRGVGVYVNGYVTGVTLRRLHVEGTGSSGIYLETGSTGTIIEDSVLTRNGGRENGPDGQLFELAGLTFWFWGPGREGVAVDGSRFNVIRRNHFERNFSGGILLYKNCGEFPDSPRYFERRYGSHGNVIEDNTFVGEENGVWIASRMAENTLPMGCTDEAYAPGYVLDHARDNTVRANTFEDVVYGVRVEDDGSTIEGNVFQSDDPAHVAILMGTPIRLLHLGLPVDGTTIAANRSEIAESKNPYRWVHGHEGTLFTDNQSFGRGVGLCEGVPPARGPFVMATGVVLAPGGVPPDIEQPPLPHPEPLDACPLRCDAATGSSSTKVLLRRLGGRPGDETLTVRTKLHVPAPHDPPLDPIETGIAARIDAVSGETLLDVTIPGGAYDATLRSGWRRLRSKKGWRYSNREADPPGGVFDVVVHDLSSRARGTIEVRLKARRRTFDAGASDPPNAVLVSLDPPTAEGGLCSRTSLAGTCDRRPGRVSCRAP